MKKTWEYLFLVVLLVVTLPNLSFAQNMATVEINGIKLIMDEPPTLVNGRTLVPLRAIFEALNVTPMWDQSTKTVTAKTDKVDMKLKIGSTNAVVNGQSVSLDVPGTLVNGRTMVPARFIAETLGAQVDWDANTKTVKIVSADAQTSVSDKQNKPDGKTIQANSYAHMKNFMNQFENSRFNEVIKLGNIETYRMELSDTTLVVDKKFKEDAQYDPKTNTITLKKDPSAIAPSDDMDMGQLIWHEISHKIEDENGDIGYFDSKLYGERNIEYMKNIIQVALPKLEQLERYNGDDAEHIKKLWSNFEKAYEDALKLPETQAYPPDKEMLKKWFGFSVDKESILEFYKSGKGGENIKKALNPQTASVWSGAWDTEFGVLVMTQSGNDVSGSYSHDVGSLAGIVSGNTLSGTWTENDDEGTFTFIMSEDGKSFSGSWQETSPDPNQGGGWDGTKQ